MIIDNEVHIFQPNWNKKCSNEPFIDKAFIQHADYEKVIELNSVKSIVSSCKKNNIRKIHLMGIPWISNKLNFENNEYVFDIQDKNQKLVEVLPIVNISKVQETIDYLKKILSRKKIIGIKVIGGWQNFSIIDSNLDKVYKFLIDNNLFFMPHINHLTQGMEKDSPQHLFGLACKFPKLKIIAPHLGGGLFLYEKFKHIKSKLKNITYISSVSATMYMAETALLYCPEKIIFGTDFPFNHCHNQSSQIEDIKKMDISQDLKDMILYKNAERIFNYKNK